MSNTINIILDNWDTEGLITKYSNPEDEYYIWHDHCLNPYFTDGWKGDELTLLDFENYINYLKEL